MKRLPGNHHRHTQQGQSMVEMALMMVILLTILSAVLDLGRGFFSFIAIQNAAGEGALYAALNPYCPNDNGNPQCAGANNVEFRAKHESPSGLVDASRMTVSVTQPPVVAEGKPITVTVLYRFTMLGPFSPLVPGGQLFFQARAVQNILDIPTH